MTEVEVRVEIDGREYTAPLCEGEPRFPVPRLKPALGSPYDPEWAFNEARRFTEDYFRGAPGGPPTATEQQQERDWGGFPGYERWRLEQDDSIDWGARLAEMLADQKCRQARAKEMREEWTRGWRRGGGF